MNGSKISQILNHLGRSLLPTPTDDLTDGQLIETFLNQRDSIAFEALVRRHGAMVLKVCQRILRNSHDAEDAFQASFLVLLRRGHELRQYPTVGNWLYGVAYHTALKARAVAMKRRTKERQASAMAPTDPRDKESLADLRPLLDQELYRLPTRFREPVVLCDLEGKTRKEAAAFLGCPEGTVASRLSRAHTLLARRLARQGLTLSSTALAAVLVQDVASATVPASLVQPTVQAALSMTVGGTAAGSALSPPIGDLVEAVLRGMFLAKLKTAVLVMLAAVALLGGLALPIASFRNHKTPELPQAQARGDEPEVLLNKAIEAGGGETALSRLKKVGWRGEAPFAGQGQQPIVLGGTCASFDHWFTYATVPVREPGVDEVLMTFKLLVVSNAPDTFVGFHKIGVPEPRADLPFQATKEQIRRGVHSSALRQDLFAIRLAQMLIPLRDRAVQLTPAGDADIEGQPATGIIVAGRDRPTLQIFFDQKTALPRKCIVQTSEGSRQSPVAHELLFSQFEDMGGAQTFTHIACNRAGIPWFTIKLLQILPQDEVETVISPETRNRYSD